MPRIRRRNLDAADQFACTPRQGGEGRQVAVGGAVDGTARLCRAELYSAVLYSAMLRGAELCRAVLYSALPSIAVPCKEVQCLVEIRKGTIPGRIPVPLPGFLDAGSSPAIGLCGEAEAVRNRQASGQQLTKVRGLASYQRHHAGADVLQSQDRANGVWHFHAP